MYDYCDYLYSDLHKDARGFRPDMGHWNSLSPDAKQQLWDRLCQELTESEHYISDDEMKRRSK